ncbi:MAG: gliding motility-associated C-terminal domain-containing protein [Crocinitomicaceae bacterium]|nr:gliding motility-associated C-terminal domain-containing protein [Crocinitomicaceae bacterium]
MSRTIFLIMALSLSQHFAMSQLPFYQDIFHGGATGDGYNASASDFTDTLKVYIEPGSTIRNAYLVVGTYHESSWGSTTDNTCVFNGTTLNLSPSTAVTFNFSDPLGSQYFKNHVIVKDVTQLVSVGQLEYPITPPIGQNATMTQTAYTNYYILISYENPALPLVCVNAFGDNIDADAIRNYSFSNLNPIDTTLDVGFTFFGDAFCDTTYDGNYIYINGNYVGLAGGDELNELSCGGVRGSFYYQNSTLYGLDNDIANAQMSGPDALARIEPYLNSTTQFNATFEYQNIGGPGPSSPKSNPIFEFYTVYTALCDTFSVSFPNDTTVCIGSQLQLSASGGQSYEWLPSTGLSCADCPNPVFTADSTMKYIVQIWNNDSCSVIRPVQINVVENPSFNSITSTPSDCGTSNGKLEIIGDTSTPGPYSYIFDGINFQAQNYFSNLPSGSYSVSLQDGNGCVVDTIITITEQNTTIASVSIDPQTGLIPLDITVTNNSSNATDYEWYLNGNFEGTSFTNFTCDTSGTYIVQLIAWQYDPSCADTAYASVIATQEVVVPTAFTPNNDQVNDTWEILNLDVQFPNNVVQVYNRWGSLIYQSKEGDYGSNPWNGTYQGEPLPVASYYFIIQLNNENTEDITGNISIIKM